MLNIVKMMIGGEGTSGFRYFLYVDITCTRLFGKLLQVKTSCVMERKNSRDRYVVVVQKVRTVIGYLLQLSAACVAG